MLSLHLLAEHGWSCQLPVVCWSSSRYSGHSFSGVPGFCPWPPSLYLGDLLQILSPNFTDDSRISSSRPDSFSDSLTNIPNSLLNSSGGFLLALLTHHLPPLLQTCSFSHVLHSRKHHHPSVQDFRVIPPSCFLPSHTPSHTVPLPRPPRRLAASACRLYCKSQESPAFSPGLLQ